MPWLILSRTIPTAIVFTILTSMLHHMLCGKAMPPVKRGSASGKQLHLFSLCLGHLLITSYNNQLPSNICTWQFPGDSTSDAEHQIWINLESMD